MRTIFITIILFITSQTLATTWAPVYPYTQKTEKGKVQIKSFPYNPFHGGNGSGETFVYHKGELLYTIDKYFINPCFTYLEGVYLIEIDFYLDYDDPIRIIDENDETSIIPKTYDGDAIKIYKNGDLMKMIKFSDLKINTSEITINENSNRFSWNYHKNNSKNLVSARIEKSPVFLTDGNLLLATSDNRVLTIDIKSGRLSKNESIEKYLAFGGKWFPSKFKRKQNKVSYPAKYSLPKTVDGKSLETGLTQLLDKEPSNNNDDSSTMQIHFHSLLINNKGECEYVSVSPSTKLKSKKEFNYSSDPALEEKIENWILKQKFGTLNFPKDFEKYEYSGFIYLK